MSKTFRHPQTAADSRCGSDACPACRRAHLRKQARPLQAALSSALAFLLGGVVPILVMLLAISRVQDAVTLSWIISAASLLCLTALGAVAAYLGRAPLLTSMLRVTLWGAAAMALTALLGVLVG